MKQFTVPLSRLVPGKHNPHVHVGMPIPVATTDANELVDLVRPAIQGCVDVVVARASAKSGVVAPARAA